MTGTDAEVAKTEEVVILDAGPSEGGADRKTRIAALASPTPIFSAPEFPPRDPSRSADERRQVVRLGSLRKGQVIEVKDSVLKKGNCAEGWFALEAGGFVCGKYATLDLQHKELQSAPHPPFIERPLPYDYGLNLTNGTPMYRRPPLRKERALYEKGLPVGKTPKKAESSVDREPAEKKADKDTPWYLQEGSHKSSLTLDDLKGESSLVELRMVRGFYVALDKQVHAFSGTFWHTNRGSYLPLDHILVHPSSTEFEGVWVGKDDEPRKLPLGFFRISAGHRYVLKEKDGAPVMRPDEPVPRFALVPLTGKRTVVPPRAYEETTDGWWMRDLDGTVIRPSPRPAGVAANEKWIDVSLSAQTLVAYEGDKPVFATVISSGVHDDDDKAKDHRTPVGSFRIREKHISTTMDDDSATDGPYSIEDVPWVMYFERGIALHGAFWHSQFGREHSHGCVNMNPSDARQIFLWATPRLPDGWHAVRATDDNPGTRVIVHN